MDIGQISPLFHNIFNISLTSVVKLHIHLWSVDVRYIFSSILQIWYVKIRMFRSISESPLDFEIIIMRVNCIIRRPILLKQWDVWLREKNKHVFCYLHCLKCMCIWWCTWYLSCHCKVEIVFVRVSVFIYNKKRYGKKSHIRGVTDMGIQL